jgi:hypothetical protein
MANDGLPSAGDSTESRPQRAAVRIAVAVAVLAWLAGVAFGMHRLWTYESTPGTKAEAPAKWPGSGRIEPVAGRATLVMFIHPLCSCTRASLAELNSILQQSGERLTAWVLVLHPKGSTGEWEKSATWSAARGLQNVRVLIDADGVEAARFGAATSGQVVLYDAKGRLQFSGGITAARGHVGTNSGEQRVVSLVNTGVADHHEHPVFGCGLHDPNPRTDTPMNGPT